MPLNYCWKESGSHQDVKACGGTAGKVPNNVFGYGVLNIYRAVIAP